MTTEEFLIDLQEVLQRDDPVSMDSVLAEMDEWDSLAVLGTVAYMHNKFGVRLNMDDFQQMITVSDIAKYATLG